MRTNQQKQQMYTLALAALGLVSGVGMDAANAAPQQPSPVTSRPSVAAKKTITKKVVRKSGVRRYSASRRVVGRRAYRRHTYRVARPSAAEAARTGVSRGNKVTSVAVHPSEFGTRIVIQGTKSFRPEIRTLGKPNATVITIPGLSEEGVGYKSVRQNGVWNVRYASQLGGTVQVVANTRQALPHVLQGSPDGTRWEVIVCKPGMSAATVAAALNPGAGVKMIASEVTPATTAGAAAVASVASPAAAPARVSSKPALMATLAAPVEPIAVAKITVGATLGAKAGSLIETTPAVVAAEKPVTAPKLAAASKGVAPDVQAAQAAPVVATVASLPAAAARPAPVAPPVAKVTPVVAKVAKAVRPAAAVAPTKAVTAKKKPLMSTAAPSATTAYPSLIAHPGSAATVAAAAVAKTTAPGTPAAAYTVRPLRSAKNRALKQDAKPAAAAAATVAPVVAAAKAATGPAATAGATLTIEQLEERRVSLDFVAADINDVLKALSLQSGINIVTGADVKGNVTVSLKRVSMTDALDMIARLSGFQYARFGSAYVVGTPASVNSIISGGGRSGTQVTEFIRYRYTAPGELYKALGDKFPGIKLPELDKAATIASPSVSKLLVLTESRERVDSVKAFVEQMEQAISLPSVGASTEIYPVKYANVNDLITILARLVPTVTAQPGPTPGFVSNASGGSATFSSSSSAPAGGGGASGGTGGGGGGTAGTPSAGGTADTSTAGNKGPRVLLLTGSTADVARAREVLTQVDVKVPQIYFEAKVMDVNREDLQKLGLRYDFTRPLDVGELDAGNGGTVNGGPARDLGFGGIFRTPYSVGMTLDALANNNRGKVLSSPNLSALDGEQATAFIGDQIKYVVSIQQTPQGQTIQTETATVGITLKVTGKASDDGTITMYVHPEVSTISSFLSLSNGIALPQISTRFVDSTVRVKDGETIAIGGLIREDDIKNLQKVPFLGDLPFFGQLFRRSDVAKRRSEIVVFITARVVKD